MAWILRSINKHELILETNSNEAVSSDSDDLMKTLWQQLITVM
jgi:hypothetical protein